VPILIKLSTGTLLLIQLLMIVGLAAPAPIWLQVVKADVWFSFCSLLVSVLLWAAYAYALPQGVDVQMPGFVCLSFSFFFAARRLTSATPPLRSYSEDFSKALYLALALLPICFDADYFPSVTADPKIWLAHSSIIFSGSHIAQRIISPRRFSFTYDFLGFPSLALTMLFVSWFEGGNNTLVAVFIMLIPFDVAWGFASDSIVPDPPNIQLLFFSVFLVMLYAGGFMQPFLVFDVAATREKLECLRVSIQEVVRGNNIERVIILGVALFTIDFARDPGLGRRLSVITMTGFVSLLLTERPGDSKETMQVQARGLVYFGGMVVYYGQTDKYRKVIPGAVAAFLYGLRVFMNMIETHQ
jgi:hypothetical protein